MDSYGRQIKKLKTVRAGALSDMVRLVDAVEGYHAALPRDRYAEMGGHVDYVQTLDEIRDWYGESTSSSTWNPKNPWPLR